MSTWRPYEPQKPEFKYRAKPRAFLDCTPYDVFEVQANGYLIGCLYSTGPFSYSLSAAPRKTYSLEVASKRLWELFRQEGG